MRCLWLTLADPDPATNGQFLYSGALIQALASAGAELDVVGLLRPGGGRRHGEGEGNIRWGRGEDGRVPGWAAALSALPYMTRRTRTREMRCVISDLMASIDDPWDVVVFDSLAMAWALIPVLKRYAGLASKPAVVYLAQNHEASLAPRVAAIHPRWIKRQLHRIDAQKVGWLE